MKITTSNNADKLKILSINDIWNEDGIYKRYGSYESWRFVIRQGIPSDSCSLRLFVEDGDVQNLNKNSWPKDKFVRCVGEKVNITFED